MFQGHRKVDASLVLQERDRVRCALDLISKKVGLRQAVIGDCGETGSLFSAQGVQRPSMAMSRGQI